MKAAIVPPTTEPKLVGFFSIRGERMRTLVLASASAALLAVLATGCKRSQTGPASGKADASSDLLPTSAVPNSTPPPAGLHKSDEKGSTSMSYDLMLSGSHRSPTAVRRRNPFTGEDVDLHPNLVSEEEVREAKRLLARYKASDGGDGRHLVVRLPDGMQLEVTVGSAADGERGAWQVRFGAFLQRLGGEAMKFLFELASAGGFVVEADDVAIATSASVKERVPDSVLVASPDEMGILLKQGFESWKAYAKQVMGK